MEAAVINAMAFLRRASDNGKKIWLSNTQLQVGRAG